MEPQEESKFLVKIIMINDVPYIWSAFEYFILRKDYRILGTLEGSVIKNSVKGFVPSTLPIRLSRIEALYLVKHGMALAFQIPALTDPDPKVSSELITELKRKRRVEQVEAYKRRRRLEIESVVEKIIEGKRKKGRGPVPDRDTVIEQEMQKVELPYETTQVDIVDPWIRESDYVPCEIPFPDTPQDKLKFKVFEDFHLRRKYFVAAGLKFGGDFLAYPGDPHYVHSEFIIVCHDTSRAPLPLNIQSLMRLARTVKKILLVATLDDTEDKVKYKVMNSWKSTKKLLQKMTANDVKMLDDKEDDA